MNCPQIHLIRNIDRTLPTMLSSNKHFFFEGAGVVPLCSSRSVSESSRLKTNIKYMSPKDSKNLKTIPLLGATSRDVTNQLLLLLHSPFSLATGWFVASTVTLHRKSKEGGGTTHLTLSNMNSIRIEQK